MVNGVNKEATLFGNCKNEKVVSVCCSARSTPVAAEASVETLAEFQGTDMVLMLLQPGPYQYKRKGAFHFIVLFGITLVCKQWQAN